MAGLLELIESPPRPTAAGLQERLVPMLEELARAFGSDRAVVALHDERRDVLRGAGGWNVDPGLVEALEVRASDTHFALAETLQTGIPHRVDDIATETHLHESTRHVFAEMGLKRFVLAPIAGAEGRPVGLVALGRARPFTNEELRAIGPVVMHAAGLVARAQDLGSFRGPTEEHAVEKEWLWWMVNGVGDPVVVTDARNEAVLRNKHAELLFKVGEGDSPGRRHAIRMNNFLFSAALSTWSLAAGRQESRELILVDPVEGDELIFEVITQPALNLVSGERGTIAMLKNVTDIRRITDELRSNLQRLQEADEEIRTERDRLDLILRSVPNAIIVLDNQSQPITMNAAAVRLLGSGRRGGPALERGDQIRLANEAKFTSFISGLSLEPMERKTGELALVDPDSDEPLEMAVAATQVRDSRGGVIASVSVLQDIGRLRELERRRVEQILFDSEKLAATGRLAASIAHEINNPLEAIQNSLYLLVNRITEEDPNHRFLDIARKETARMSRILRGLLGFYRPTATMDPTDVNALVDEAESLLSRRLRERRVRVDKTLAPGLPRIRASADQIKQVLLNLVLNAAEAMPEGGTVSVSTHYLPGGRATLVASGAVQVQVRDTGLGIPEEMQTRIFEPFFSTKEGKGTGLGLWVSSGIVQAHGGTLQVRSGEGRGTTFLMTLPVSGPRVAEGTS